MALFKIFLSYSILAGLITIVICLILQPVITLNIPALSMANEKKALNTQTQYQSVTAKDDCHLCVENPNDMLQFYFGESNIALINFESKKITPLEESVLGFSFGDFYVKSSYQKENKKIDLLVWYSPVR